MHLLPYTSWTSPPFFSTSSKYAIPSSRYLLSCVNALINSNTSLSCFELLLCAVKWIFSLLLLRFQKTCYFFKITFKTFYDFVWRESGYIENLHLIILHILLHFLIHQSPIHGHSLALSIFFLSNSIQS